MASQTSGIAPIIESPITEESFNTTTTKGSGNTLSASAIGSSAYSVTGDGAVSITAADFGAITAAKDISLAGIASVQHGYDLLSGLTGQALLANSKGITNQTQPLGVTLGKYAAILLGIFVAGWVLVALFTHKKKEKAK